METGCLSRRKVNSKVLEVWGLGNWLRQQWGRYWKRHRWKGKVHQTGSERLRWWEDSRLQSSGPHVEIRVQELPEPGSSLGRHCYDQVQNFCIKLFFLKQHSKIKWSSSHSISWKAEMKKTTREMEVWRRVAALHACVSPEPAWNLGPSTAAPGWPGCETLWTALLIYPSSILMLPGVKESLAGEMKPLNTPPTLPLTHSCRRPPRVNG